MQLTPSFGGGAGNIATTQQCQRLVCLFCVVRDAHESWWGHGVGISLTPRWDPLPIFPRDDQGQIDHHTQHTHKYPRFPYPSLPIHSTITLSPLTHTPHGVPPPLSPNDNARTPKIDATKTGHRQTTVSSVAVSANSRHPTPLPWTSRSRGRRKTLGQRGTRWKRAPVLGKRPGREPIIGVFIIVFTIIHVYFFLHNV